jgi:hypothetical protein
MTDSDPLEIVCPFCEESGCEHCDDGFLKLTTCPQKFIGPEMVSQINITAACTDGVLPVSGGLLDQSAYWFSLKSCLESDQAKIERSDRNG